MKHTKTYRGLENGAGQIVCACGFETPAVDDSSAFTLGRKQRSVESYYEEHLALLGDLRDLVIESALSGQTVEAQMLSPANEKAVTPAHKPPSKKRR
jgi:hypothetical protein